MKIVIDLEASVLYSLYMIINDKTIRWYKRSGHKVSAKFVLRAKQSYADCKRTGSIGPLRCAVNLKLAEAIDNMSLIEFANYTGQFTYRIERKRR